MVSDRRHGMLFYVCEPRTASPRSVFLSLSHSPSVCHVPGLEGLFGVVLVLRALRACHSSDRNAENVTEPFLALSVSQFRSSGVQHESGGAWIFSIVRLTEAALRRRGPDDQSHSQKH